MLGVTPALRSLGVIRSDEATLSPGLRTARLLQPHAWVGYWWQHTRLCPLCHNSRLLDFVSHKLPIGDVIRDIPPHGPQDNLPLELTLLKIDHTAPPPPHNQGRSIADYPSRARLRQSIPASFQPARANIKTNPASRDTHVITACKRPLSSLQSSTLGLLVCG